MRARVQLLGQSMTSENLTDEQLQSLKESLPDYAQLEVIDDINEIHRRQSAAEDAGDGESADFWQELAIEYGV